MIVKVSLFLCSSSDETRLKEVFTSLRQWRPKDNEENGYDMKLKFLDEAGKEVSSGSPFKSIAAETDYLPIKVSIQFDTLVMIS